MATIMVDGVEEKLPLFMADKEESCLLGLDFLVQSAGCVGLGRMQMQVRGETVPLILEDTAEQVDSPVTSSDVEDERLELHCRVVREGGEIGEVGEGARGRLQPRCPRPWLHAAGSALQHCRQSADKADTLPPRRVQLAKRKKMQLPLNLATVQPELGVLLDIG
ncbi:hypothetical protein E2C01_021206 [Portunus trituberculatus]|uniref:Uncharacterized protein n=1 Tax=Portunus trituberculatus TaxID=210409 RepID=A0A5B7E416_PORTR|nr:hypothetical protein [Portunus trituberculatus]